MFNTMSIYITYVYIISFVTLLDFNVSYRVSTICSHFKPFIIGNHLPSYASIPSYHAIQHQSTVTSLNEGVLGYKGEISLVEYIKKNVPLSEVVGHYVKELIPTSSNSYKCLCPFHDDRNPSLTFSDQKGKFFIHEKCFQLF